MAIFRGVGGSGDSSDNSFLDAVTAQANSASASATSAANSLAAIQQTEVTSASFNTGDGVLTLTKTGGATVTADLDGRFLTSYTETNNLSTAVTWANVPDANITESSVTQHMTAANVTSPLTGGTGISVASNGTITNDSPDQTVALTGTGATTITGTYPNFTINSVNTTYTVGDGGLTTNDFTDADHTKLNGIEANATADQTGSEIKSAYEAVADTNAFTDAEKTKLSGIEASADVTDATNVTAAGALMDSEVTNLAQVKAFDSSDYATAAQGTTATNALPKSGGEVTGNITGFIDIRNFYSSLNHQMGSSQSLTTTFTTVGADSQYTHSGLGTKTIDVSLDILYYNVSYTNDAELRFVMTAPNPATESTVNLGNVVAIGNVSGYQTNVEVSGDFTKHFSNYMGLANSSDGTNSLGVIYKYYYDGANDRTIIQINSQASLPSVGSPIYLHPFDWESSGTDVISAVYQVDFTTDSTVLTRRDYNEHLGYFTSSVAVKTQMRESTTSENVTINEMRGKLTRVGN